MQAAQRLFQDGHISYHRTDSTTLSEKALAESASAIREMFGDDYYGGPRRYATKVKNAQEAHEAIRPTNFGSAAGVARRRRSSGDDLRLYELIWKRTMASQMVDARVLRTTVEISAPAPTASRPCSPRPARRSSSPASAAPTSKAATIRRPSSRSRRPCCRSSPSASRSIATRRGVAAARASSRERHETTPPARYTEASLIKELERLGIGRPSTYAATIGTIERRGYVFRQGKALVPSFTAFAVTRLLREHFGDLVDVEFTAEMEEDLDQISRGERDWLDFISSSIAATSIIAASKTRSSRRRRRADYPLIDVGVDPESGEPIRVRIGRYGPFLQLGDGGPGKTAVAAADAGAGRSDGREGDGADSRQGRRAAPARRRSEDRHERLRDQRPLRRLRAARRDAGEGQRRRSRSARRSPAA